MYPKIYTKWGIAQVQNGYYCVKGKKLHRLIYEDNNNCTLLSTTHIHHRNGNKLDNSIDNLIALTPAEHAHEHKIMRDQEEKESHKRELCKKHEVVGNGFPRIVLMRNGEYSYLWKYYYGYNRLRIWAGQIINNDIKDLKKIVLQNDLTWRE